MIQIESPEGAPPAEPIPPPVEAQPEPPAEPEPPAQPDGDDPGTGLRKAAKTVIDDLREERAERRAATAENQRLRAELDDAKRMASQVESMRAELDALKPKAPVAPVVSDEDAEATARRYALYTTEGTLDIKAGRAIQTDLLVRTREAAREIAREEIAPLRAQTVEQQANANERAAVVRIQTEKKCTVETFKALTSKMTAEQRANEDVMNTALLLAEAVDARNGTTPTKPATVVREAPEPPLHTEAPGGRRLAPGPLSDLETRAAKDTGMTGEQWKKHTDNFKPGVSNRLE